ncbi:TIGR04104 family putative zinc finger protein [Bacillus sp. JJ1562]|uniref:TIGR04104 family putative zinc finger protein n=1 Tax=Bacillus sp. JJ1562 TaxID=3122960 RepID=UPI0030011FE6
MWSWKQTIKKSLTYKNAMSCPYCGENQYISSRTRKRTAVIGFIAPALILVNLFLDSPLVILYTMMGLIPLFIVIYPFYLELSNKEEPLF